MGRARIAGAAGIGTVIAMSVMLVGCEEVAPPAAAGSASAVAIRDALDVPAAVEVVVLGETAEGVRYVLRNPAVRESRSASSRTLGSASAATSAELGGVGRQFDSIEDVARPSAIGVQFVETQSYTDVHASRESARNLVGQAGGLIGRYGDALAIGGVDVEAIREWMTRQQGVVDQLHARVQRTWASEDAGPRFPIDEYELTCVEGTTITPVVLPAATGGLPPLVYGFNLPFGTGGGHLPSGLSLNASTRTISGTCTDSISSGDAWFNVNDAMHRDDAIRVVWEIRP